MSRSRVALLGVCGVFGATLLVSPLVNWNGGKAPSGAAGAYDPLLAEASCGDSDSQLALISRPADEAARKELAFLEGIMPAGGEGAMLGTGTLYEQPDVDPAPGGLGIILPEGTVLPGGAIPPSGPPISAGTLPPNTVLPIGTVLPGGAVLPNGYTVPPGTIIDPPEQDVAGLPPSGPNSFTVPDEECEGTECDEQNNNNPPCIGDECQQQTNNSPNGDGPGETQNIVVAVSEPASLGLLGLGLLMLGVRRRRSK